MINILKCSAFAFSFRLTVLLAGYRYIFLSCRTLQAYVSRSGRVLTGICIVVIISTILCIPSYIEHHITETIINETHPSTNRTHKSKSYRFDETKISKYLSLRDIVFVLHGFIFKLIPCILLLLFSFLLIQQLRNALKTAEELHKQYLTSTNVMNNGRIRGRKREKENRRTTLMLVIVCILFLITELPQGAILLLAFLSKKKSRYYYHIYQQLGMSKCIYFFSINKILIFFFIGDTFDILALINNSINFILYCLMSRAFRNTFKRIFCICQTVSHQDSTVSFSRLLVQKNERI